MPELPEVEVVRRELNTLKGFVPVSVSTTKKNLRKPLPDFSTVLEKPLTCVQRRGKYLVLNFSDTRILSHLGMTGMWCINRTTPYEILRFQSYTGDFLVYQDIRRFGSVEICDDLDKYFQERRLGVDPFSPDFSEDYLRETLEKCRLPMFRYLLEQKFIAGLGTIYVNELCFRLQIHPLQSTKNLVDKAPMIRKKLKTLLRTAICLGGSSIKDFRSPLGNLGSATKIHKVYGRSGKPCVRCGATIQRIKAQRPLFFCPNCQRLL